MGLLADSYYVIAGLLEYEILRLRRRINASVDACFLVAAGLGILVVGLVFLLAALYAWLAAIASPAVAYFLTAAASFLTTGGLAAGSVKLFRGPQAPANQGR